MLGYLGHDNATDGVFPLAIGIHMLKLNSFHFELEGFMSAHFEAIASVAVQADITHGEDPRFSIDDLLPRFLLEGDHKGRLLHLYHDFVVTEILV